MMRWLLFFVCVLPLCGAEPCEAEISPAGKILKNRTLTLTLLPECGTRVQSCRAYGTELLLPCRVQKHQGNPLFAPGRVTGGGIRERFWKQNGSEAPLAAECRETADGGLEFFSPAHDNTCFSLRKQIALLPDGFRVRLTVTNTAKEARETALWITVVPVPGSKVEFPGHVAPAKNGSSWYPAGKGAPEFCTGNVRGKLIFPAALRYLSWCGDLGRAAVRTVEAVSPPCLFAPGESREFFYEIHFSKQDEKNDRISL